MARKIDDEMCFIEALNNAYLCFRTENIPPEVQDILDHPRAETPATEFWALVHTLNIFVNKDQTNKQLPVSGKVLDMTSKTDFYIDLQKVYREKAAQDLALFKELFNGVKATFMLDINTSDDNI